MAKGNYKREFGGSKNGYDKGYNDAKKEGFLGSLLKELSKIAKAISESKKK